MKNDCQHFIQHYAFNKNSKHFAKLENGHCMKKRKINCENCPHYAPHNIKNERVWFAVSLTMIYIKKVLDKLEQEISKM